MSAQDEESPELEKRRRYEPSGQWDEPSALEFVRSARRARGGPGARTCDGLMRVSDSNGPAAE
jgi:hypothetical protein